MASALEPTDHTSIRRTERASYDTRLIYRVLDEALIAHVGFVDRDRPVVIPLLHARVDEALLLHGSPASRLFRLLKTSPEVCITVTLLDGLVLARSAFHHSANYRSVVIFGRPRAIDDPTAKRQALDAFTDKLVPGRRPHLREMTDKEVRGTAVLQVEISEASAKLRSGPPVDDEADYELPIWAGVLPHETSWGRPVADPRNRPDVTVPAHVSEMVE